MLLQLYTNLINAHSKDIYIQHDTVTLPKPCGLSYDWMAQNLYVSDCLARKIALINPQKGKEISIISDGIQNVKSLVVEPLSG